LIKAIVILCSSTFLPASPQLAPPHLEIKTNASHSDMILFQCGGSAGEGYILKEMIMIFGGLHSSKWLCAPKKGSTSDAPSLLLLDRFTKNPPNQHFFGNTPLYFLHHHQNEVRHSISDNDGRSCRCGRCRWFSRHWLSREVGEFCKYDMTYYHRWHWF